MPEGVEQAAQAFEQQIKVVPTADRSRDADTGRFVQTASKPEPIFEPRPVEGDPETGDTNDGGENARYLEHERRVADGRSEDREGTRQNRMDATRPESLSDGDARARQADRGGRRDGQRSEGSEASDAERISGKTEGRGDNEGDESPERSKGEPERDAEGEESGEGVLKYEVNVDGQTIEVSLPEALKGYIREQTFHQRMNQVDQARNQVLADAQGAYQVRDTLLARLQEADRLLAELTPPEPDWDQEFRINGQAARERQKAYQQVYAKRAAVQQEMQQAQQVNLQAYDNYTRDYAVRQFSDFVKEANIPDEKVLDETMELMRSYARKEGFNEGEIATVYDKRMLRILRKAALYDQSVTAQPKAVIPGKGRTLTPGSATPMGNAPRRHIDEAQNRLAKSGRLDDAAAVFQRLLK